jgi:hypothetical protein
LSVVPAALFLMDFGGKEPVLNIADEVLAADEPAIVADVATDPVDEAYARGVEDGKAAVEAEIEARLQEQKEMFDRDLAASRDSSCIEQGARIADRLQAAIEDMEGRIADSTERVLRPFLEQAIRAQAVAELCATLKELAGKTPGITLEITGPEDLLAAVRASLPASVATVSYNANEACDVQVKAGASILETRIAAWLDQIEGPRL